MSHSVPTLLELEFKGITEQIEADHGAVILMKVGRLKAGTHEALRSTVSSHVKLDENLNFLRDQ